MTASPRSVQLGAFRFDPEKGALRGPEGPVPLSDRERDVLTRLVRASGLVTREELGGPGGSRAADMAVSRLRRRLGEDGGRIRTVRGRGYSLARAPDPRRGLDLGWGRIDLDHGLVRRGHDIVSLSTKERALLGALCETPGRPVARRELARRVFGAPGAEARLDVLVHRLRSRLEVDPSRPRFLTTVRGRGLSLLDTRPRRGRAGGLPPGRGLRGRGPALDRVLALLEERGRAVVHGPPGIGKSALARAAAEAWRDRSAGSVQWVDLDAVRGAEEVEGRLAGALGVEAVDRAEVVGRALADRGPLVLVIDGGGDHVPFRRLSDWQRSAPALRVLVASRFAPAEWPQVLLAGLPAASARAVLEEAAGRPLTDEAERLARRLEGNPWALELAGHALRHAALDDLERRPGSSFAPLRRAWEAALESLSPPEHAVVLAAGLFRGPFAPTDVIPVARGFGPERIPRDVLAGLVARSVLRAEGARFRLPQAARDLLAPAIRRHPGRARAEDRRDRRLEVVLSELVGDLPRRGGPALDELDARWPDLGPRLGGPTASARELVLLAELARQGVGRAPRPRRDRWASGLERGATRSDLPPADRARCLRSLHALRWAEMSRADRRALLEQALELAVGGGDARLAAGVAAELASVVAFAGEPAHAAALMRAHPMPDDAPSGAVAERLRHEGRMEVFAGRPERGTARLRTAVVLAEDEGLPLLEARCRMALGQALSVATLGREAEHHLRRALALTDAHGLPEERVRAGVRLAQHLLRLGLRDEAADLLREAMSAAIRAGLEPLEEQCAAALGFLLIGRRRPAEALAPLDRAVALARRHGGRRGLYVALCNRGLARGLCEHVSEGITDLSEALDSGAGAGWYAALGRAYRAVVLLIAGDPSAARDAAAAAAAAAELQHPDARGLVEAMRWVRGLAEGAPPGPARAWVEGHTGSAELECVALGVAVFTDADVASPARG